jgi:A1 cistron-splicing factor AAR2
MAVQQVAELLVHEGGSLVIIGVPEGTEIGIDYNSWNVGHQFKGIKMIPPGLHFIYYSAVNKDQSQTAPRTGFFYWFKQKEFLVKYWDPVNEEITDEGVDDVTIQRLKENIIELNNYLGSYPNSSLKKWLPLTNHITPEIINRIQPEKGHISAVTQVLSDDCAVVQKSIIEDPPRSDQPLEDPESIEAPPVSTTGASCPNKQPNEAKYFAGVGEFTESEPLPPCKDADHHPSEVTFSPNMEYALRFNVIPRQKHPVGATPSEITLCNLDLSYALEVFIDSFYHDNSFGILGELQFAFVCFLIGQGNIM